MFLNKIKNFSKFYVQSQILSNKFKIQPSLLLLHSRKNSWRSFSSQKTMSQNDFCDKIVWMDLEMTGLDIKKDKILEVSCLITDKDLNILSEGPCFAVQTKKEMLDEMNEWCKKHHNESGLVKKCLESQLTMEQAEKILLDYLIEQQIPQGKVPVAGNSIYMDRLFIRDQLPRVDDYLHYRVIDVSTIKELARRWNPKLLNTAPQKALKHRSMDDIKDSIAELRYYRECFFQHDG